MIKRNGWLSPVIASVAVAASCSDDGALGGNSALNGIALEATNPGPEEVVYVTWSSNNADADELYVTFCYEDGECETRTSGSQGVAKPHTVSAAASDPDRRVVGAKFLVEVRDGDLEVRAVRGSSEGEMPWPDFETDSVLEDFGRVSEGEVISFTIGDLSALDADES